MTGEPGAKGAPHPPTDEGAQGQDVFGPGERDRDALLAYVGEHLALVRRTASGERPSYWIASGHEKIPVCGQLAPGVRSSEFPVHGHEISRRAACPDTCGPSGMGGFEVSVSRPSSRRDRDQVWQGDHGDSGGL
jgi:hypothetical protein